MRNRWRQLGVLAVLVLLAACAQVVTPNGGPKDTQAPVVVNYTPDSAATNVTGKRVVIRFNEYVTLSGLSEQLIVSPPLNTPPEVSIRKKEIVLDFKDTLRANTTYTISFGNAIRDITEGNILDNFRYVFSTGPVIDSLRIRGRVTNARTLAGEKEVLVLLYTSTADSTPYKERPYYFTKTRTDGSFEMTNLRPGRYKVVALLDKDANYRYTGDDELIGFRDSLLTLNANCDTLQLGVFQEANPKQRIVQATQPVAGKISIVLAYPARQPAITCKSELPPGTTLFTDRNRTGDTLTLWMSNSRLDTLMLHLSDGGVVFDSAAVRTFDPKDKRVRPRGGDPDARRLLVWGSVNNNQKADLYAPYFVNTSVPVRSFNAAGIRLTRGRDTLRITPVLDSATGRRIRLLPALQEDSAYKLVVLPGTITDWFGQVNKDTLTLNFRPKTPDDYGNLKVTFKNLKPGNYLLQVVNERGGVLQEFSVKPGDVVSVPHLNPGQYALRLITDSNTNGRYDTGNYLQHRQPEKVRIYGGAIKVRAGWDLDVDWKLK